MLVPRLTREAILPNVVISPFSYLATRDQCQTLKPPLPELCQTETPTSLCSYLAFDSRPIAPVPSKACQRRQRASDHLRTNKSLRKLATVLLIASHETGLLKHEVSELAGASTRLENQNGNGIQECAHMTHR